MHSREEDIKSNTTHNALSRFFHRFFNKRFGVDGRFLRALWHTTPLYFVLKSLPSDALFQWHWHEPIGLSSSLSLSLSEAVCYKRRREFFNETTSLPSSIRENEILAILWYAFDVWIRFCSQAWHEDTTEFVELPILSSAKGSVLL